MHINLGLNMGSFTTVVTTSAAAHMYLCTGARSRGSAGSGQEGRWVGLCGLWGWDYSLLLVFFSFFYWGHTCIYVVFLYLGEEIEAAQAADDAVDLGKPPAFAAGLWRRRQRKRQNQNSEVSQDRSSKNNLGIRAAEQSKAFSAHSLSLHWRVKGMKTLD